MKVHVEQFKNNSSNGISDVISGIEAGITNGIVTLRFQTKDKYVRINSSCGGGREDIYVSPHILDNDGYYLEDSNPDEYFNHPDYYCLSLGINVNYSNEPVVIPLKHEYFITFIPLDMLTSHQGVSPAEIVTGEE